MRPQSFACELLNRGISTALNPRLFWLLHTPKIKRFRKSFRTMSDEELPPQDEDFSIDTTDAGASTTFPMQAGLIRKGGHIVINGRPCKVADISTSKTGKHGHAKANIVGIDIFTDRKYEDICPTSHNVDVPHVTKREYPVLDISDDGFCSLMCDDGSTKDDLRVPAGELGDKIREEFAAGKNVVVNVTRAMDEEHILAFKLAADS